MVSEAAVLSRSGSLSPYPYSHPLFGLTRAEYFSLVFLLAVTNSILPWIATNIATGGIVLSAANTFEVSAIVWFGIIIGVRFALNAELKAFSSLDYMAGAVVVTACIMPLGSATWIVTTAFAAYVILTNRPEDTLHRAGWIFLACSVPMFWSKRLFNFFADYILAADAFLVSSVTQTERIGNLVRMPGSDGVLEIQGGCSSLANVSLAVLCWVLFTQWNNVKWRPSNMVWCLIACLAVITINVSRMTIIGYFPEHYTLLHGPLGNTVTSWVIMIVTAFTCHTGVKHCR